MPILLVTDTDEEWPAQIHNVRIVGAREYLTDPTYHGLRNIKIFNLCRSYRYQSTGYYVSLLAEARGHRPIPSITTLQDLKLQVTVRPVSEELDDLIQQSLAMIRSQRFTLSIYFGRNLAKRYNRLALHLYNQFQSPLLRAHFQRDKQGWQLRRVATLSASDVPEPHRPFAIQVAGEHFAGRYSGVKKSTPPRFELAILHAPQDPEPPSDEKALRKFIRAAAKVGIHAQMITRDDYGRLAEFDALFIRDTTSVNQYTYRFSRRAAREGLVVIDDPQSIVRCTNKVYLAELLARHKLPTAKTMVVHRDNATAIGQELGYPCVLKIPDGSFSNGVVKVADPTELQSRLDDFFDKSDFIVAQEYLPTTFDWRIGILDRLPLFACKYYMAQGHWQIIRQDRVGPRRYGKSETLPVELAPAKAVQIALKAANLIGDGLYGVDIKESEGKFYIIEVNDNPNVDSGAEDAVLKDELYRRVMSVFLRRIEQRKAGVDVN